MSNETIAIKTRLNDGIYASCGGGEVRTRYTYKTGPRNLVAAIKQLFSHKKEMSQGYGNIGCGRSWLEINGKEVDEFDLQMVLDDDKDLYPREERAYHTIKTQTQKAKELIASISDGSTTANSLQHIAKLARDVITKATVTEGEDE